MRRQLAGPNSSHYKEKDHKVTKAIDPALTMVSNDKTYLKKQEDHFMNNQSGVEVSKPKVPESKTSESPNKN